MLILKQKKIISMLDVAQSAQNNIRKLDKSIDNKAGPLLGIESILKMECNQTNHNTLKKSSANQNKEDLDNIKYTIKPIMKCK